MEEKEPNQPLRLIPRLEKLTTVGWPRGYIGCSVIGHECDRYIWLNKYGEFTYEIPFKLGRIFDRGNLEENRIVSLIERLNKVSILKRQANFKIPLKNPVLKGNCDAILRDRETSRLYILELKTMNDRNFKILKKYGIAKSNSLYWSQCQAYMKLANNHCKELGKQVLFLVVNKNDESLYEEIVDYDPVVGDGLFAKAKRISKMKEMPDGIFSTDKKPQTCFTCSFHKHCYGDTHAETHC